MGKRDLKKQYTELNFNFVDLVSLLDTTPTKKLTPFLVKQFNDWIQYRPDEKMESSSEYEKLRKTLGQPKNELDEIMKRMLFKWAQPKLDIINEFTEHLESNRLEENDINKYDNWNAIKLAINEAEIKQGVKNKKNRVMILHQDDEWLILKPLSMEASINYGYGTKWCTSMKNSHSYFHKYSRNGVLVFVINRKNGVKYAIYSSPKEYSVWTATDARIDSMETTIPFDLMMRMKEWTNFDEVGPNYNYFEDEDKDDMRLKKRGHLVALGSLRSERIERDEIEDLDVDGDMEEMGEPDRNEDMVEATISVTTSNFGNRVIDESEDEAPAPSDPMVGNEITFRADSWDIVDEAPQGDYSWEPEDTYAEPMGDMESPRVNVDITDHDEAMVGYGDSVHGTITNQGERTWDSPYPNGPGGGFENNGGEMVEEMTDAQFESAIPANEETAEMMGSLNASNDFDERDSYEDTERAG